MSPPSSAPHAFEPDVTRRLPYAFAKRHGVLLIRDTPFALEVRVRAGVRASVLAELRRAFRKEVRVEETDPGAFADALNAAYERGMEQARTIVQDLEEDLDLAAIAQSLPKAADLLESEDDAPVVRLINALLTQALREGASDIHLEPFDAKLVVRLRVDGILRDILELQKALHALLVSRIKILSSLDIAEQRLPQDGRFTLRLAGRSVDVRVSTLLTGQGERVVLRLLDKKAEQLDLAALGLPEDSLAALGRLIASPHGILLVTGPTGSGKTTTLYAALTRLNTKQRNILTVEDPIEYALEGVGQTQVNAKIELDFARALRAILRQDPDVVMIGEIRDLESAQIAVQASLTGHLVLATLHTNDAVGAVLRLREMGIEPFLVASSLLGVLAQRLVRRLCPECRRPYAPADAERALLDAAGIDGSGPLYAPAGCRACGQTGYQGRTGIYELLLIDDPLRQLIQSGVGEPQVRDFARRRGMKSLRQDGLRWVRSGVTSLEELLRVASE